MLEIALRSSSILVAAWVLVRALPRATAATRHLIWHTALIASVLVPLATLVPLPQIAVIPELPQVSIGAPRDRVASEAPVASARPSVSASPIVAPASPLDADMLSTTGIIGTVVFALWFVSGWVRAARVSRAATEAPSAWQLELNALCDRLRIGREVRLGMLEHAGSPLATGVRRAMVLLPPSAAAWTADRRRAVLLHELAHIKRHDCRVQLIAQAACALYWFNPLVWMAAAELRSERERACDDEVLRLGAQASSYAAHLLDIARELRPSMRPSAALAMARPSDLEGRLLAVLAAGRSRVPRRGTRWAVVIILSLVSAGALSATQRTPQISPAAHDAIGASTSRYVVSNDVTASSQPAPAPLTKAEITLRESHDPQDRERAALALAFTSGRDVVPALLKALNDSDSQVREKAALGLAMRRDPRVVEPLIAAMSDPDSQVREKAAIALGTSGDARARDVLTRALDDSDSQVREKAAAALILFGMTK
jgi:beta-lactamase regulating signal transducer with metallopeptidase domain